MEPIGISENDILDAKNLIDLHSVRLKKLKEVCDIEKKIKELESKRSEWVKICSNSEERVIKKKNSNVFGEKKKPLNKFILEILFVSQNGLSFEEIVKSAMLHCSKNIKNVTATCRQYLYNMKKEGIIVRDDSTFKYFLSDMTKENFKGSSSSNNETVSLNEVAGADSTSSTDTNVL